MGLVVSGISQHGDVRRSLWYAVLVGIGVMAAVDEIVFHQLLHWHHCVDRATPFIGIVSDGILHAMELLAITIGAATLIGLAREGVFHGAAVRVGMLLGAGGFQLFDGLVNHKILRIHQVRYGVDPLLYDIAWNAAGAVLLFAGCWMLICLRREGRDVAR